MLQYIFEYDNSFKEKINGIKMVTMDGGTQTAGEDKPRRRKIYVGFSRDFMSTESSDDIYVGLNLYQKDIIQIRGVSQRQFLLGGKVIFAFDKEIENNPCGYIKSLAKENSCEVDYSPAIDRGLNMINKLETMVDEVAKQLGVIVV